MKSKELIQVIEDLSSKYNVKSVTIQDWKECGEFDGDNPMPVMKIEYHSEKFKTVFSNKIDPAHLPHKI